MGRVPPKEIVTLLCEAFFKSFYFVATFLLHLCCKWFYNSGVQRDKEKIMKKFKIYTFYLKNDRKIELMGGADTFKEAKEMAIDFEKQMNEKHISIFKRTTVKVKNRETDQRWELNCDDNYDSVELLEY